MDSFPQSVVSDELGIGIRVYNFYSKPFIGELLVRQGDGYQAISLLDVLDLIEGVQSAVYGLTLFGMEASFYIEESEHAAQLKNLGDNIGELRILRGDCLVHCRSFPIIEGLRAIGKMIKEVCELIARFDSEFDVEAALLKPNIRIHARGAL